MAQDLKLSLIHICYLSGYSSIVLTTDDKLVVGDIGSWDQYNIRDGIQFYPVLIADGIQQVTGSAGSVSYTHLRYRPDIQALLLLSDVLKAMSYQRDFTLFFLGKM